MHITIEHFEGKYPSFNINLHADEDSEAFLSIKGCSIKDGEKGPFISYPAKKNEQTGKYWRHVWSNDKFSQAVIKKAQASAPKAEKPKAKYMEF